MSQTPVVYVYALSQDISETIEFSTIIHRFASMRYQRGFLCHCFESLFIFYGSGARLFLKAALYKSIKITTAEPAWKE